MAEVFDFPVERHLWYGDDTIGHGEIHARIDGTRELATHMRGESGRYGSWSHTTEGAGCDEAAGTGIAMATRMKIGSDDWTEIARGAKRGDEIIATMPSTEFLGEEAQAVTEVLFPIEPLMSAGKFFVAVRNARFFESGVQSPIGGQQ